MSAEYERDIEAKSINLLKHFAENFQTLLAQTPSAPFSLDRVSFDVKSESSDPDGTKYTTVKPVVFEKVQDFGGNGFYLLRSSKETYLVEMEEQNHYSEQVHFIGITRVPNPDADENKSKWAEGARLGRVRPMFQNQSDYVTSALGILLTGGRDSSARLYGTDIYLKPFFEALKS